MYKAKEIIRVILLFFCVSVLMGCRKQEEEIVVLEEVNLEEVSEETESGDTEEEKDTIFVHVCGQVVDPGVYEMTEGSRIYEVIQMAGGMMESAAGDYVNQAQVLVDGQRIYIPTMEEAEQGMMQESTVSVVESGIKVNINTASKEELMTLTGIGEVRAEAILAYRQEKGVFGNIKELMLVEGIKKGTYDKIKDQITV